MTIYREREEDLRRRKYEQEQEDIRRLKEEERLLLQHQKDLEQSYEHELTGGRLFERILIPYLLPTEGGDMQLDLDDKVIVSLWCGYISMH